MDIGDIVVVIDGNGVVFGKVSGLQDDGGTVEITSCTGDNDFTIRVDDGLKIRASVLIFGWADPRFLVVPQNFKRAQAQHELEHSPFASLAVCQEVRAWAAAHLRRTGMDCNPFRSTIGF